MEGTTKYITVHVTYETELEIDVDNLDPMFVDIEGFAKDEAARMIQDDIDTGSLFAECMDFNIIKPNNQT